MAERRPLAFAREGARVAVVDLMVDAAQETVAQINHAGGQAMSLTGDITDARLVQRMIGSVVGANRLAAVTDRPKC